MTSNRLRLFFTATLAGSAAVLFSAEVPSALMASPAPSSIILRGSSAQITAAVLEVLARPDPLVRLAGVAEVLRQMTPENYEAVHLAFQRDYALGRSSGFESGLIHIRIGQVMGSKVLQERLPKTAADDLHGAAALQIEGWASVKPAEALEWFKTWPRWRSRRSIAAALVSGLASHDVEAAEAFCAGLEGDLRLHVFPTLVSRVFSQKEFPKAMAWSEKMLAAPTVPGSAPWDELTKKAIIGRVLEASCNFQSPSEMRSLLARHAHATYFGKTEAQRMFKELAYREPVATLDWLPTVLLPPDPDGSPLGFREFNREWIKQDEAGLINWTASHREHPLCDYVIWTHGVSLAKRSGVDEGRKRIEAMKDASLRTAALASLTTSP